MAGIYLLAYLLFVLIPAPAWGFENLDPGVYEVEIVELPALSRHRPPKVFRKPVERRPGTL
jgi:hypothetical protein